MDEGRYESREMETGACWKGFEVSDQFEGQDPREGVRKLETLEPNCWVAPSNKCMALSEPQSLHVCRDVYLTC